MLNRFQASVAVWGTGMAAWLRLIRGLRNMPSIMQIIQVNQIMNARPYVPDTRDYWATPGEFFRFGGDCEDFVIAKYLALRDLGHREDDMRIVVVYDLYKQIPHAILVVRDRHSGGQYVLDNQNKALKRLADVHRYHPIYSINRGGWWFHNQPIAV